MLIGTLRFFLLLDGRDYTPRGTSSPDHVLVGDGKQISLVDSELTAELKVMSITRV